MKVYASFLIARKGSGFAATTRPDGRIGLPGGKVENGETSHAAVLRESREEGWAVTGPVTFHHTDTVEGQVVAWFTTKTARKLRKYKEKSRGIRPIVASGATLAASGMGNQFLAHY